LALSENDKSETKRRLDEHSEKIEQLTEPVEALFAEPLAYRRPPLSPKILEIKFRKSRKPGNSRGIFFEKYAHTQIPR
jgi:hypothetical protein